MTTTATKTTKVPALAAPVGVFGSGDSRADQSGLFGTLFGGPKHSYRSHDFHASPSYSGYAPAYSAPVSQPVYYRPARRPVPNYRPAYQTAGHGSYHTRYCREDASTVYIDGRPQYSHGTACYQPDGSWRIVK